MTRFYFTLAAPHQWVILDRRGVSAAGTADELRSLPLDRGYDRIVAVAPGESIITRAIDLPVRNRQKLLSAIPYAIEDSLIEPVETVHFALLETARDGQAQFAYVAKGLMDDWLESCAEAGISLDGLLPDYLLLPTPAAKDTAVLVQLDDDRLLARSGRHLGAALDATMLPAWLKAHESLACIQVNEQALADKLESLGVKDVSVHDIGVDLAGWLRKGEPDSGPGLLQGDYGASGGRPGMGRFRVAAVIALLALLIKLGGDAIELNWLSRTHDRLGQQITTLFQDLFPGARLVPGKARVQMQARLESLQRAGGDDDFARLLSAVAGRMSAAGARIEELRYQDGKLDVICTLRDFAHLDRVRQSLEQQTGFEVRLVQSGARGNQVQARFEISGRVT